MSPVGDPAQAPSSAPRVLLVGEIGARLEVDLGAAGLACTVAPTAAAAVGWMRASRFDIVIAPQLLTDMQGPAFALGVVQHFPNAVVLLYGAEIEGADLQAYARQGRVVAVPPNTNGFAVGDYIMRRLTGSGSGPVPIPASAQAPPTSTVPRAAPLIATSVGGIEMLEVTAPNAALHGRRVPSEADEPVAQVEVIPPSSSPFSGPQAVTLVPDAPIEDDRVTHLAQESVELQARAAAAEQALADEKAARDALAQEIVDVRVLLAERERERDEAAAQRDELRVDIESAKAALEEAKASAAAQAQAAATGEADGLRAEVERLRGDLERTMADFVESQKAAAAAEQVKTRVVSELVSVKTELAGLRAADGPEARLLALNAERDALIAEGAKQREAHEALESKATAIANTARRLAGELKTQSETAQGATAGLEVATARIGELEAVVAQDKAKLEAAAQERDGLRLEMRALQSQFAATQGKLETERGQAAAMAAELAASKAEQKAALEQLEVGRGMATDEVKLADHDKRKVEARAAELTRQLEEAKKKGEETRQQLYEARQLRDDAEMQVADVEIQLADVKSQIDEAKHTKKLLEDTRAQLERAKHEGEAIRLELGEANLKHDAAQSRIDALTSDLAGAQDEIARLIVMTENSHASAAVVKTASMTPQETADSQALEARLDAVTRERDRAIAALMEASRKVMELEDERS